MTCIIGLEHKGHVYIGADSAAATGWKVRKSRLHKVFRINEFLIGYTSSFRMGQLLQYKLQVKQREKKQSRDTYMVTVFAEAVRECLKTGGYTTIENNEETGGTFLIGYQGCLYDSVSDFQINSNVDGISAVGCGGDFALGAMRALAYLSPRKRIKQALKITAYFSGGVCGPFRIMKL